MLYWRVQVVFFVGVQLDISKPRIPRSGSINHTTTTVAPERAPPPTTASFNQRAEQTINEVVGTAAAAAATQVCKLTADTYL